MKAFGGFIISVASAAIAQDCPGYIASDVETTDAGLTANLYLAGEPCNIYGDDVANLTLTVRYQTNQRLHVLIQDAEEQVFQIQESLIPRPPASETPAVESDLVFDLIQDPFSFTVLRRESGEVLFDTSSDALIFESQYVRLRTLLPENPNVYGFGEHSDPFRLPIGDDYQRTLWNREAPFIPRRSNLYGSHPMYLEHRDSGTHGVLLLSSSGMDVNFNETEDGLPYIEYNTIGGVLDFYFFAGPSPTDVSRQQAAALGLPAMMPYWSLGYHQAKYGYWDVNYLAEVVANHSAANIPLEVIWADIDHMDLRKDFTVDPERFPAEKMREFVTTIHDRHQRFVMILDPGVSTDSDYVTFTRGQALGAFLKADDGSDYRGVQWAGEVVWPDYMSEEAQTWWDQEFASFFDPDTGFNIDGVWIDMNEASNFCPDIQCDPRQHAEDTDTPPEPANPPRDNTGRPIAGFPDSFQPQSLLRVRQEPVGDKKGLAGRDFFQPLYEINNGLGNISDNTIYTNITNHDGTRIYDTHNMYGLAMAKATYRSMLARAPGLRPFVLTRSTFLTSGRWAAHWFGDNASTWDDYRVSIVQMLGFAAVHNVPMVGTDVCGFNGEAEENMCARWATLASFMPFMRNHADISAPVQEFYLWESVAEAAQRALSARYRLLDYVYTALYRASSMGVPSVNPLFFLYPQDSSTYGIDLQFVLGEGILVCPVVEDNAQSVTFYLPDDIFYDFWTWAPVRGAGADVTLEDVALTDIPVYIRGGSVIPLRSESAETTAALREKSFTLVVAAGLDGSARGWLYLDDGESLEAESSYIEFSWDGATLEAAGKFGYVSGMSVESVVVLGEEGNRTVQGDWSLDERFEVSGFD